MILVLAVSFVCGVAHSWADHIIAKDLIQHLLCVDTSQRYSIDEFLAHPWCNAVPAPPPPPTLRSYSDFGKPLDSPLLSAARGRVQEGKSPGIAALKEAFDVTYAVHRMEEEGARRHKYNGRAAGARGFLSNLNKDDEDEGGNGFCNEDGEQSNRTSNPATIHDGCAGPRDVDLTSGTGGGRRSHKRGTKEFELDLRGATLLGRRHKKSTTKSPLSTQPIQAEPGPHPEHIGSPMHS